MDRLDTNEQALNDIAEACRLLLKSFCACANWPKDRDGMVGLAEILDAASRRCGISMQAIVDTCRDSSVLCPTAHDLQRVAGEMKVRLDEAKEAHQHDRWRKEYGPPDPQWSQNLIQQASRNIPPKTAREECTDDLKILVYRGIWHSLYYVEGAGCGRFVERFWQNAFDQYQANYPELVTEIRQQWQDAKYPADPPEIPVAAIQKMSNTRRDDELWSKLRHKFPAGHWPNWKVLAQAARELGYEDYAQAWERS